MMIERCLTHRWNTGNSIYVCLIIHMTMQWLPCYPRLNQCSGIRIEDARKLIRWRTSQKHGF